MIVAPTFNLELALSNVEGRSLVAGLDEAGRGPWAGPLVAAAVIFNIATFTLEGIRDSKTLSAKQRAELAEQIKSSAVTWAIGEVSHEEIDQHGIQLANKLAMKRAIDHLSVTPDYILTDYVGRIEFRTPFAAIVRGDSVSLSIAAASIVAKVYRDGLMVRYAEQYPEYGFDRHKGYGTRFHAAMLAKYGPCPIHRFSFTPVAAAAKTR